MMPEKFLPEFDTAFWCSKCDHVLIPPRTAAGNFYRMAGHVMRPGKIEGEEYVCICWAVCKDCEAAYNKSGSSKAPEYLCDDPSCDTCRQQNV